MTLCKTLFLNVLKPLFFGNPLEWRILKSLATLASYCLIKSLPYFVKVLTPKNPDTSLTQLGFIQCKSIGDSYERISS